MDRKSATYPVLVVTEGNEPARPWSRHVTRICKWLDAKLPFILYAEQPFGKIQIRQQLKRRKSFKREQWKKEYDNVAEIEALLEIVAIEGCWPNHNFIPEDPLRYALLSGNYNALYWIPIWLKRKYNIDCLPRQLHERAESGWTVGEFVKFVFAEARKLQASTGENDP